METKSASSIVNPWLKNIKHVSGVAPKNNGILEIRRLVLRKVAQGGCPSKLQ